MASQASKFPALDFSITSPFKHVRLMEVPDEVLEIIASSKASATGTRLKFKSSPSPDNTATLSGNFSAAKSKDSVLHLCSDDKIWAVKQVSTSNSVYLFEPSLANNTSEVQISNGHASHSDGDDGLVDDPSENTQPVRGAVSAIAQVGNFLELQPIKVDEDEIKQMILQLLPLYYPLEVTENDPLHYAGSKTPVSLQALLNDIPAPARIIERVCSRLCMIKDISTGCCMIPSPAALLRTWSAIIEGCSIESVRLDQVIDTNRIVDVLSEPVEKDIAYSMLGMEGMFVDFGLMTLESSPSEKDSPLRSLKPLETSIFIAILLMKFKSQPPTSLRQMDAIAFLEQWTVLVPTTFVKHCTIEALGSRELVSTSTNVDEDETITWSEELLNTDYVLDRSSSDTKLTATNVKDTIAKPTTTGKRKWHEKFAAQRAAKK